MGKREQIEEKIVKYALYEPDPDKIIEAPIGEIVDLKKYRQVSNGVQARIFLSEEDGWVIKEGRWDLDFDLAKDRKLPVPAQLAETILGVFDFTFLPNKKEIARQYRDYLIFMHYFGYFKNESDYYHPDLKNIIKRQKMVRERLLETIGELSEFYKLDIDGKVLDIIDKTKVDHNFLPKEYLLYGKSLSPQNKEKPTSFIFQHYVKGTNLYDHKHKDWDGEIRSEMILLTLLILYLNYEQNMVPDTRPRYFLFETDDWIAKTDNVIVSELGLKFIDTRWMWNRKGNIIKRGVIIPELVIHHSRNYFLKLIDEL